MKQIILMNKEQNRVVNKMEFNTQHITLSGDLCYGYTGMFTPVILEDSFKTTLKAWWWGLVKIEVNISIKLQDVYIPKGGYIWALDTTSGNVFKLWHHLSSNQSSKVLKDGNVMIKGVGVFSPDNYVLFDF